MRRRPVDLDHTDKQVCLMIQVSVLSFILSCGAYGLFSLVEMVR